jgi:hypothetical protein
MPELGRKTPFCNSGIFGSFSNASMSTPACPPKPRTEARAAKAEPARRRAAAKGGREGGACPPTRRCEGWREGGLTTL